MWIYSLIAGVCDLFYNLLNKAFSFHNRYIIRFIVLVIHTQYFDILTLTRFVEHFIYINQIALYVYSFLYVFVPLCIRSFDHYIYSIKYI
jgi:hypothetical protein